MSTIINGTSSAITFPDSTVQNSAGLVAGGTIASATITALTTTTATLPTATVTTLNAPSGVLATQNGMTGIAKAWVNFTGSTGAITGSFNVGSITRNGTGDYTVNFTTAMPNATYSAFITVNNLRIPQPTVYSTGSVRMNNYTTGGSLSDSTFVNVAVISS